MLNSLRNRSSAFYGKAVAAAAAALMCRDASVNSISRMPKSLGGLDMRYLEQSFRKPGKSYPFSSTRQNERFSRNYTSDDTGSIRPYTRAERRLHRAETGLV